MVWRFGREAYSGFASSAYKTDTAEWALSLRISHIAHNFDLEM